MGAQRRPRLGRRGEVERIAERRVRALELRKSGSSYRQIAEALAVDTHTAWADVASELAALRETTVVEATELRALELERLDGMTSGLWPHIQAGSPPAVSAAVRVSERRAKLLGLDEPTATRTEISGSLSTADQARLRAEIEEVRRLLTFEELQELAERSNALFADAIARAKARTIPMSLALPPSSVGSPVDGAVVEAPSSDVSVPPPITDSVSASATSPGEPMDHSEGRGKSGEHPSGNDADSRVGEETHGHGVASEYNHLCSNRVSAGITTQVNMATGMIVDSACCNSTGSRNG